LTNHSPTQLLQIQVLNALILGQRLPKGLAAASWLRLKPLFENLLQQELEGILRMNGARNLVH